MLIANWETGKIRNLLVAVIYVYPHCQDFRSRLCLMHLAIVSCFCWNKGFLTIICIIPFIFPSFVALLYEVSREIVLCQS